VRVRVGREWLLLLLLLLELRELKGAQLRSDLVGILSVYTRHLLLRLLHHAHVDVLLMRRDLLLLLLESFDLLLNSKLLHCCKLGQ